MTRNIFEEVHKEYEYKGYSIEHIMFGSMNFWEVRKWSDGNNYDRIATLGTEQQCKYFIDKL